MFDYDWEHHHALHDLHERLKRVEDNQRQTDRKVDALVDQVDEVTQGFEALKSDVTTKLGEFATEVNKIEGEIPDPGKLTALKGMIADFDTQVKGTTVTPTPAPTPTPPPANTPVSVSIGATGEGESVIAAEPANVTIAAQPASGTASVEAVEGQPDQTRVKVVNATPDSTQTVEVAIATPASAPTPPAPGA